MRRLPPYLVMALLLALVAGTIAAVVSYQLRHPAPHRSILETVP